MVNTKYVEIDGMSIDISAYPCIAVQLDKLNRNDDETLNDADFENGKASVVASAFVTAQEECL